MRDYILFSRENFSDMYPEIIPLSIKHYHEIAWNIEKIPLDVDVDKYVLLQENGSLVCFSVRNNGMLIGYALFLIHPHPHYKSTMFASNDVVFLEKAYRGSDYAKHFLQFCEEELKCLGCKVIAIRIKNCLDWSSLAQYLGFESVESTHLKWIGD